MVATLVKLRWRLTINSLRGVWWKILLEAWLFLNLFALLRSAIFICRLKMQNGFM